MRKPNPARPLADDELARIDALLEAIDPDAAMVLEELDGFLTALACSPRPLPDEIAIAIACGADDGDDDTVPGLDWATAWAAASASPELGELAGLLRRHRLSITAALHAGEGLEPVMERDEAGESAGNLWAIGFLRGIDAQAEEWAGLDEDADLADWLEPFELLAVERDLVSDEIVAPIDGDRQAVVEDMIDSAFAFYHHHEPARSRASAPATVRRAHPAPGRNDPCPCGSGRKYKRCCGAADKETR
ncbi:MAG: UPF0149 family protein [Burkholderiaceae bacterium]